MYKITKDEIVMLVWDLPMWVIDEIKWGIYNRCRALAIKLGFDL